MLEMQKPKAIKGPVSVEYQVEDKDRGDLANYEKAVTDLLVYHGMIEGDGREVVRRIAMDWAQIEGVRVTVKGMGEI